MWRWYIDPGDNQVWWTDDSGNFIPDNQYTRQRDASYYSTFGSDPFGGTGVGGGTGGGGTGSPYTPPSAGAGGGGGVEIVGGLDQIADNQWQIQADYLNRSLAEQQRQFDAQLALDAQRLGMSQQEIDMRREQFNAQLENQKQEFLKNYELDLKRIGLSQQQIDNQMAQFTQNLGWEKEKFGEQNKLDWAKMLAGLSGPRDYLKYQMAQAQLPANVRGGNMNIMEIANSSPAFGAMTPDSTNSWEHVFSQYMQGLNQPPGGVGNPVAGYPPPEQPPAGTQPPPGEIVGGGGYGRPPQASVPPGGVETPAVNMAQGVPGGQATQVQQDQWRKMMGGQGTDRAGAPVVGYQPGGISRQQASPASSGTGAGVGNPVVGYNPGDPGQNSGTEQWTGGMAPGNRRTSGQTASFAQPNQISQAEYTRMAPSARSMLEGQWSASGVDPNDAWSRMRAGWNYGSASTKNRWR